MRYKNEMEYTPTQLLAVPEVSIEVVCQLSTESIVRRLPVFRGTFDHDRLLFHTEALPLPLRIVCNAKMTFGTETVTARDYSYRVIEHGDMIDAVIRPVVDGAYPMTAYWIHIKYVGEPAQAGDFSKKDDGLFAMRTKAGEKAERVAAKPLWEQYRHSFPESLRISPGYFEIYYKGKKKRKPDRICLVCGLTFEVKKRNRDRHFRVSHSPDRPFSAENLLNGWHVFVFPDMTTHFVPNALIAQAIATGNFIQGEDQYDKWADVDTLTPCDPPYCTGKH